MDSIERYRILDSGDYLAGFDSGEVQLLTTGGGPFQGHCARAPLGALEIAWGLEQQPRVAFVALRSERVVFSFPTHPESTIILCGEPVLFGQLAWHPPGAQFHERSMSGTQWGRIHVPIEILGSIGEHGGGGIHNVEFPQYIAVPEPQLHHALLSIFNNIIAPAMPTLGNEYVPENATLMGAKLFGFLTDCLKTARFLSPTIANRRRHTAMLQFQRNLAGWSEQPMHIQDICARLNVPPRTLEDYCYAELGVAPYRYLRLYRLAQVRKALLAATPATINISTVSRRYGFLDLGRFAATYRAAFDELPSQTLARAPLV